MNFINIVIKMVYATLTAMKAMNNTVVLHIAMIIKQVVAMYAIWIIVTVNATAMKRSVMIKLLAVSVMPDITLLPAMDTRSASLALRTHIPLPLGRPADVLA